MRSRPEAVRLAVVVLAAACGGAGGDAARDGAAPAADATSLAPPPPAALATALAAVERESAARMPQGAGRDAVIGSCLTCHSASLITQQHKDTAGWNKTVTLMVSWGAPVRAEQKPVVIAYLAEHFGARAPGPQPPQSH